jgi:DnaJ like chaperone protein
MPWETIADRVGLGAGVVRSALTAAMRRLKRKTPAHQSAAFTSAFVALAAKMAKADGVAVPAEVEAFERFLGVQPHDAPTVRRLFDLAKRDTAGFDLYAERIGRLLRDEPDLKQSVLECLMCVACSDGVLHPAEDEFVKTVAEKFGFSPQDFRKIRALFVRDSNSPYETLGVPPDAPEADVRARYRKLVLDNHPDRVAASGAPAAVVKAASAKLATINAAYDAIVAERNAGGRA